MSEHILITGGAGFIGSNFVHYFVKNYPAYNLIVLDKLTYAGNMNNLTGVMDKIKFIKGDICDASLVRQIFEDYNISGVIHFAAESHVDNSIENPFIFTSTNIVGTHVLLEVARQYWGTNQTKKFVHVSTDEVYGSLEDFDEKFTEESLIKPNSPYSASKASSDLLALAYAHTYGMNISVTNCSNNYGPRQHKEKLIPHIIDCILHEKMFPIYGNGQNIRDWLYVEDHCKAISLVFFAGTPGERYNIGGNNERSNLEIVRLIFREFDYSNEMIDFVEDRKGHDYRYAIDSSKIQDELGWEPETNFMDGLRRTIDWYLHNEIQK